MNTKPAPSAEKYLADMKYIGSNKQVVWEENHMLVVMQAALQAAMIRGAELMQQAAIEKGQFSVDYFKDQSVVDGLGIKETEACRHAVADLRDAIRQLSAEQIVKG